MSPHLPSPPFASSQSIAVVVPTHFDGIDEITRQHLQNMPTLLNENRAALERELGAPFRIVETDPGSGPRWLIGPAAYNPTLATLRPSATTPQLFLDRAQALLISDAPSVDDVWDTFSLIRSLSRFAGGCLPVADCQDIDEAIQRIIDEVGDSFPAFGLHGLDWATVCARHSERVRSSPTPIVAIQEWLAELQDAHTWLRPAVPLKDRPYRLWATPDQAIFCHVPPDSAAGQAGVQAGFRLLGEDTAGWWRRCASPPHMRPLLTGRRLLMDEAGVTRSFEAQAPDGRRITWLDTVPDDIWNPIAEWQRLSSGAGYLKIRAWLQGRNLEEIIDHALRELADAPGLIVDLRNNPGGDLAMAYRFRNRFVHKVSVVGTIRTRLTDSSLSEHAPIYAEPAPESQRWCKPVRFLTDLTTYSAAEDVLLGLQGQDHVEVIGEPSGGGSGRMRILRLLPGWRLTISTALTYDLKGHCIEGAGIPVDRHIVPHRFTPNAPDIVLQAANQSW